MAKRDERLVHFEKILSFDENGGFRIETQTEKNLNSF